MSQKDIRAMIENILDSSSVGTMATVKAKKPHSRYMTFFHKGLKLYTVTNVNTHKAEEIEENPYTHVLLGYEGEGFGDEYVEYEGKVTINDDLALKKELWNPHMKNWFDGPEDPEYVVLEIEPIQISLLNKKGLDPKTLEF